MIVILIFVIAKVELGLEPGSLNKTPRLILNIGSSNDYFMGPYLRMQSYILDRKVAEV